MKAIVSCKRHKTNVLFFVILSYSWYYSTKTTYNYLSTIIILKNITENKLYINTILKALLQSKHDS